MYAVGELNGSVGINGKHGLDGMFLGPAILTGRICKFVLAGFMLRQFCCRLKRAGSGAAEIWSPLEALGYEGRRIQGAGALAARGDRGDGDYLFRAAGLG